MTIRIAIVFCFALSSLQAQGVEPLRAGLPTVSETQLAELAKKLSDPNYHVREDAAKSLREFGIAAIPQLQLIVKGDHFEAATRANELIAQINRKAANDAALAPSLVTLAFDNRPLQEVLAAIHIQTGYKILIPDDPTAVNKTISIKTAGKVPVWEALELIGAKLGLRVIDAQSTHKVLSAPSDDREALLRKKEAELVQSIRQKKLEEFTIQVEILKKKLELNQAVEPNLKGKEKVEAQTNILNLKAEIAYSEKQIRAYKELLGQAAEPIETPRGSIVMKPYTGPRLPTSVAGSVRIAAIPFPTADYTKLPSNRVPVLLELTPEPHMKWVNTTEVYAYRAINQSDHELKTDFTSYTLPFELYQQQFNGRRRRQLQLESSMEYIPPGEYTYGPKQAYLKLNVNDQSPSVRLKTLEGVIYANAWTESGEVMAIRNLKKGEAQNTTGPHHAALSAELSVDPEDKFRTYLDVELTYNPNKIGVMSDDKIRADAHGLKLTDDAGNPYILGTMFSSEQLAAFNDFSYEQFTRIKVRILVRPVDAKKAGPPTTLTMIGSTIKQIVIPFKLTDVPVATATGTDIPKQEPDIIYKR